MERFSFCSLWLEPWCHWRLYPVTSSRSAVWPCYLQTMLTDWAILVTTSLGRQLALTFWCHVVLVFTPTPPPHPPSNLAYPTPMHCHQPSSCFGTWLVSNDVLRWTRTCNTACVCSALSGGFISLAIVALYLYSCNTVLHEMFRLMCNTHILSANLAWFDPIHKHLDAIVCHLILTRKQQLNFG